MRWAEARDHVGFTLAVAHCLFQHSGTRTLASPPGDSHAHYEASAVTIARHTNCLSAYPWVMPVAMSEHSSGSGMRGEVVY